MSDNEKAPVHPFEARKLGIAPFRLVGKREQEICYGEAVIGFVGGARVTTKPGGTCEYCGTYIRHMWEVESADGKRFVVGSDCVGKAGGAVATAVERAIAKERAAANAVKKAAKDAATKAQIDELRIELAALIEANPEGEPADYARFCMKRAGVAGLKKAIAKFSK